MGLIDDLEDMLERECSSFCMDDETDRRMTAEAIERFLRNREKDNAERDGSKDEAVQRVR